jgi:hypothetical protein
MPASQNKTQKRFRCRKGHRQVPPKSKNCVRVGVGRVYYVKSRNDGKDGEVSTLADAVNNVYSYERKNGWSKTDIKAEFMESGGEMFGYIRTNRGPSTRKDLSDRKQMLENWFKPLKN